jgi:hypothetical protein
VAFALHMAGGGTGGEGPGPGSSYGSVTAGAPLL